jgi:hypothetical protein
MKVEYKGRWYTRDHPREIQWPGLMGFEEIRGWWREFLSNPAYGWKEAALCQAMGCKKGSINGRLGFAWIWPNEQKKFTVRINEIREGTLVPRRLDGRLQAVYVDPPEPPMVREVKTIAMRATVKGLEFGPPPPKFGLPSFKNAFSAHVISRSKKWGAYR